jgi:hypothetical protein
MRIDRPEDALSTHPSMDTDHEKFQVILADWLPLTYALNAVNRSMGRDDFVLSPTVVEKLTWVHRTTIATAETTTHHRSGGPH